ncbi:HesB/IscA family protein KNAG_0B01520 [Huiozyma naganishii CBS 8797]|uniref:Core domain-containing protein n=1 Tax=Huiozyma naganishii (strain ATCC MYA-139 / BCRC 22969 / CBS 8797 / KCTC 17520 / NBRC 10181 / NCYC 3082 / Yp74L-3) TaxID=1071383 RepID=J7S3A0_HUIN7|nr:hypothetical protein KNAG_0B01520 [Kazachstania naganishii CBS 8797]CCK68599.1 hypothetical protein KNAG_0B01520 [Kazachstania naganishii CBS 8797]
MFFRGSRNFVRFASSNLAASLVQPRQVLNLADQKLNLNITQRAANKLSDIYDSSKEYLSIDVESGGCHGYQYNLHLKKEVPTSKAVTEAEDDEFGGRAQDSIVYLLNPKGKVMIDPQSLKILNNSTLNYTTELIGSSFKIESAALKSKCGCGTSFDVEGDSEKS